MAEKQLAVVDPSGRLLAELSPVAAASRIALVPIAPAEPVAGCAAILVAPLVAGELGPAPAGGPPRWIVGDGANPGRLAAAASSATAAGVLLAPVSLAALGAIANAEPTIAEFDLVRARGLVATSLVDLTGRAVETLLAVAGGFGASDCVVWWKDGQQMVPTAARPWPDERYRAEIAGAARIAAAAAGTVITSGSQPRSVIADALRSSPTEVSGLVAVVADVARRFSVAERTDLKALAIRLTRELSWLTSHRRLVADGERLLAASLHDPLTGALSRGAFERTIAHEAAAAARRGEALALAVIDIVGLRGINLAHGHAAGDDVLAQVASRVRATVRGTDPIGRLGGDEIGVLLIGATAEQAAQVMRKLLDNVRPPAIALDLEIELSVELRAIVTALAAGERSGEAALARCDGALRGTPAGEVRVVAADARVLPEKPGAHTGGLSAGTIVGGTYRVVHELSRGAMGVVYRGEDLGLGRPVAIKVLRSDLASDRELVARFRAEAGLLASLHHPNLVQVHALGEHAGDVYFVMELVEGQPLSEVLRAANARDERIPTAAVAQIALEIADALDAMHAIGVVHRDVKPGNILLDRERGRAVLVDLGVAVRAGDEHGTAGTPGFAAPESFLEHTDAPAMDVYALGATVYCMLTGKAPFGAGPAPQVVQRQLGEPLAPASERRDELSAAVDAVLAKALSPAPKKRWSSASTFAIALARALDHLPDVHARSPRAAPAPSQAAELVLAPSSGIECVEAAPVVSLRAITGQVRAAHLRVLSRLLSHHLGDTWIAQLLEQAPALAGSLSASLAPLGWAPLADLVAGFETARRLVPSQLVARKVGRGTMSATFARLSGADPTTLSAEAVLDALPEIWGRYHDWAEASVSVAPGSADVLVDGYPGSADVCALVTAELERIVELTGASAVRAMHTSCAMAGAARCEYHVTWTR